MIIREYEAKSLELVRAHEEQDHEGSDGGCQCLYWAAKWREAATSYVTISAGQAGYSPQV